MRFKFVTLNIWNGGRLLTEARKFLHQTQPDLIFIQEAYNGHGSKLAERFKTVELLQADFPDYYASFAPGYCDDRKLEGPIDDGQLILSRWPLLDIENIMLDLPYGKYDQENTTDFQNFPASIQKATLNLADQMIILMNVHGPVNYNGQEDDSRRLRLADLIMSNLTKNSIVAGDFNVQRQTKTISLLEDHLISVFKSEQKTTFNLKRKDLIKHPGFATAAVDMVFVTPSLEVLSHVSPEVDVSDHLPLVAELKLKS